MVKKVEENTTKIGVGNQIKIGGFFRAIKTTPGAKFRIEECSFYRMIGIGQKWSMLKEELR
ncbi:hypothetical protein QG516_10480 [Pedobacter gandavensis]|uniref:hypothetical protein n=1 Tax=Pedobacter gandavensis TaxID=2679963 RepID=UPI00247AC645|nr:hypothetical protein [Pedobacter gandavensis]WGQ12063.1 hypothetical protein QG516_10480 [Pedobacter gandavensis]